MYMHIYIPTHVPICEIYTYIQIYGIYNAYRQVYLKGYLKGCLKSNLLYVWGGYLTSTRGTNGGVCAGGALNFVHQQSESSSTSSESSSTVTLLPWLQCKRAKCVVLVCGALEECVLANRYICERTIEGKHSLCAFQIFLCFLVRPAAALTHRFRTLGKHTSLIP